MKSMEDIRTRLAGIVPGQQDLNKRNWLRILIQRWDNFMSDTPERKPKDSFNIKVDGGVVVSKQAIWRTLVVIFTMFTSGGVVATKLENNTLRQDMAANRAEIAAGKSEAAANKAETAVLLSIFKSAIDDVVNFLVEEKAVQKTQAAKERYQKQIENIRAKLKPISSNDLLARPPFRSERVNESKEN